MTINPTFIELCSLLYTAESVTLSVEASEDKGLHAVLAGVSHRDVKRDKVVQEQNEKIELLKTQLLDIQIANDSSITKANIIAYVDQSYRSRPRSRPDS